MANSQLVDKTFQIPSNVLKYIQTTLVSNPSGEGVKRAKFMLNNGVITYQAMKRLKNYFDYYNPQTGNKIEYALAGGDLMRDFVETTLNRERDGVSKGKVIRQDMHSDPNSELKPVNARVDTLNESNLSKNVVAVIVNDDNKFLLVKRSDFPDQWMPSKWGLVGGGVNKNETPEKACKREIKEETGIEIDKFVKTFSIQRTPDNLEHIFACRFSGDLSEITLDKESAGYGFFDTSEIEFLDTVPNLMEYITLCFTKYD